MTVSLFSIALLTTLASQEPSLSLQGPSLSLRERSRAPLEPNSAEGVLDRLRFYANGRMRAESTFDQPNGEDRHRGRMRFRIGAEYEIDENLRAEARLSTTSDGRDPNNPYWDFGDGGDGSEGIDTVFDRFFLDWQASDDLRVRTGKIPHAFAAPPVYSEFTWDDDVHGAGLATFWNPTGDEDFDVRIVDYIVEENADDSDPNMFGLQVNVSFDVDDQTELQVGSGIQWWTSLSSGVFGNQGNTVDGSGVIEEDFTVWDSYIAASHEGGVLERQQLFLQFVNNIDDDSGEDTGLALGFDLGTREPGDASYFLAWYDFDANAFFSPVAQDDTPIAGTGTGEGMTGFLGGVRYVISKNLAVRVWGLTSDAGEDEDPWRLRVDLDFSVD